MTIDMTFERRMELSAKENFEDGLAQGMAQGLEQGLKSLVVSLESVGATKEKAVECISREYNKSENEAKELVEKYW